MTQKTLIVVAAVFALLAAGIVAGYALSQHDPTDSSEGISDDELNVKLQEYATDLKTYGGKIVTHNAALTVPMGTNVTVSNGDLIFVYSGSTYNVPYEGISYILVYHA